MGGVGGGGLRISTFACYTYPFQFLIFMYVKYPSSPTVSEDAGIAISSSKSLTKF